MASTMVDAAPTRLYPKLYPTLDDSSAHFLPIQPQRGEEEREEAEEGVVPNGEEEGGTSLVNGEREEDEEEEGKLESSDQEENSACRDSPSVVVSPSQASSATGSARETTAEGDNTEQTTNGDVTMTDCPQSPTNHTIEGKLHTAVSGETVDESRLAKREEYVDRVWDEFVTHFLLGSCHIQKAAIFDLATRRPLAMNGNLRISTEEMEQLVNSLHYLQLAYRNGVTLEGKTYKVRLADGRNGILARTDREGCTVCKTHTLIIIGVHDERGNSRKCNEDVMRLGDFFRKKAV